MFENTHTILKALKVAKTVQLGQLLIQLVAAIGGRRGAGQGNPVPRPKIT